MIEQFQELAIQEVQPNDLDEIEHLELQANPYPWSRKKISDSLFGSHHCLKLTLSNNTIGYIVIREVVSDLEILNFVIAKKFQNQGLGRRFFNIILEMDQFCSLQKVWLEVRESNVVARKLYENLGFRESRIRWNYYDGRDQPENGIELVLELNRSGRTSNY